jgi:hypothetical protein
MMYPHLELSDLQNNHYPCVTHLPLCRRAMIRAKPKSVILLMRLSRKRLSARANAFIFPRLYPLPAYTAESDVYEDNEDRKLNKRSESQKGELHMNSTILFK